MFDRIQDTEFDAATTDNDATAREPSPDLSAESLTADGLGITDTPPGGGGGGAGSGGG